MKRSNRGWGIVVVGTVLAQAALTGCQVKPRNVTIERSPALQERTVRVALVGLADFEVDEWKMIELREFWEPGNARRKNAKNDGYLRVWVFKAGTDPSHEVLQKTDPIWDVWTRRDRNAVWLMVIADNLPGQRFLVLSLKTKYWKKRDIELSLRKQEIHLVTKPYSVK